MEDAMSHIWIARIEYVSGAVVTRQGRWPDMPLFMQREHARKWAAGLTGIVDARITLARLVGEVDAEGRKKHRIAEQCSVITNHG